MTDQQSRCLLVAGVASLPGNAGWWQKKNPRGYRLVFFKIACMVWVLTINLTRGVGMDSAALSGRLAATAIGEAEKTGKPVAEIYARKMKNLVNQTRKN